MINKMKIEEHNILDGQTWYHIKYDNTAPKTAFLFTYLPYNMDQAWTYEGGREHTANGGFTLTHKTTNGFLRRISPVETNVVTSFNMNNMKVDAIVWKSFAGKKYGFTLTNDKFLFLAGDH